MCRHAIEPLDKGSTAHAVCTQCYNAITYGWCVFLCRCITFNLLGSHNQMLARLVSVCVCVCACVVRELTYMYMTSCRVLIATSFTAQTSDEGEVAKLLQLALGIAIHCEQKQGTYVRT